MSVADRLRAYRLGRLLSFLSVGAVGVAVDLAITFALLSSLSPLVANAVGWSVAVTHNFAGNWWVTFGQPDGSLPRQYGAYVGAHALTFGVRAVVLSGILAATALPATVATLGGVAVAAGVNFLVSERIFAGDVVTTLNRAVHRVWDSRVRGLLLAIGGYQIVFAAYARVLDVVTPPGRQLQVGGVTATVATATPTETVSVLHTLENERDVLTAVVDDVTPGDHVVDVGANVGVFAALAAAAGADITAVEPHAPTADRLRANVPGADVYELALGAGVGTVGLDLTNDRPGTQRAAIADGGRVPQRPGDRLATPDVLKIDVEGAESAVLDGYARTLTNARVRVIYIEVHGMAARDTITTQLAEYGYAPTAAFDVGAAETMLRFEKP
jgi:FkbM family methyltransferase